MTDDHTHTGLVVGGRYHLLRLVGEGGMATVFKAYDRQADRFVALKILRRGVRGDRIALERFQREAKATAAIRHPNVAIVFDFGTEADRPYLVMEYVRGRPISRVLSVESTFAPGRAARIAELALQGLAAAHAAGVVHRDLKPSNIMLAAAPTEPEVPKLCDFGAAAWSDLAYRLDEADRRLTPSMTMFGTPAYAAPERLQGLSAAPDPRSDIYSMGVALFEMLAGLRPFDASDLPSLAHQVVHREPPDLTELRPGVSPALAAVIVRALAKDPSQRWQSAADMARALAPFAARPEAEEDRESDSLTADLLRVRERARGRRRQEVEALLRERGAAIDAQHGEAALSPPDTFSELQTAPLPDSGRRAISTAVVRALQRWIDGSFTPAERGLLEQELDEAESGARWVACRPVARQIEEIDDRLGHGDLQLVPQVGRALAGADLVAWGAPQTPGAVLARIPHAASTMLRGVEVNVSNVAEGGGQLEMMERGTPSLTLCIVALGFLEQTLQRFGAREVEVNLSSCRALGDGRCCIDVTYLPSLQAPLVD